MSHKTTRNPGAARSVVAARAVSLGVALLLLLTGLLLGVSAAETQNPARKTPKQPHYRTAARAALSLPQNKPQTSLRRGKTSPVKRTSAYELTDEGLPELAADVTFESGPLDHGACCDSATCDGGECAVSACGLDPCADGPCYPFFGCRLHGLWVRSEYLLWWTEGFSVPPLVTTSPAITARDVAGVLGEPNTTILAGDNRLAGDARSGGRISFGYWFDPGKISGFEASYMGLGHGVSRTRFESAGDPILARPFFNVEAGFEGQDAELVAYPGLWRGDVEIHGETSFQGVELLWRRSLSQPRNYRVDFLAGWRYNRLDDDLLIRDSRTVLPGAGAGLGLVDGTTLEEFDRFETDNVFHGAELGVVASVRRRCWTMEVLMKLALGNTHSTVFIDGSTTTTVPVAPPAVAVTPAGLLAQGTNSGVYESNEFAVIPELGITLGYDLTSRMRATFGYSFIYWSRVARPGDQIDTDLNLTQLGVGGLVGNPRPRFTWRDTDMWAQGLNFGLDYRF